MSKFLQHLWPFVHDVKQEKMYSGGDCRQLTDPWSVWMKMEPCILLVGWTSNFKALDKANNDKDINDDDNVNNVDDNVNFDLFMEGIQYTIYTGCVYNVLSLSISSLYSKSTLSAGKSNKCVNKHGQRQRTSKGLTNNMQRVKDREFKQLQCQLNTDAIYIRFSWVEFMSTDYFKVIDAINDCYQKMLKIGKCMEVFWPGCGCWSDILTAKKSKWSLSTQKKTYSCGTINKSQQVHQDSQYPLMLKLYQIQENMQTSRSQCLLKGKYLSKNRFLSRNL